MGVAHLELEPWGSLIATPATDLHEAAVARLTRQLVGQLPESFEVGTNGPAWRVPDGSGYLNMPDMTVLSAGWHLRDGEHFAPPPHLVIEVASPPTRVVDRNRKRDDYLLGGAEAYLLVDLPTQAPVDVVTFTLVRPGEPARSAEGEIALTMAGKPVRLDLSALR